jgi:hypothetical protein
MFGIEVDPEIHTDEEFRFYLGRITLGEHSESFQAASWLWSADRYRHQWHRAATALAAGAERSGFVTSFVHPDADINFIWQAWRERDVVYFQERLLLREDLPSVFDPDRIADFIDDRRTHTEEGHEISEWQVDLEAIRRFAA